MVKGRMVTPKYSYSLNMIDMLKEIYNPSPPECVILHREGKLSKIEEVVYASEIEEWKDDKNYLKDLVYKENPFLKLIK
jgi:hypothetical protein